jgi:hypothetical protein
MEDDISFDLVGDSSFKSYEMTWDIFEGIYDPTIDDVTDSGIITETVTNLTSFALKATDKIWGMEVGDDRVDISQSKTRLEFGLKAQEAFFEMKTSLKDTFITNDIWNFCEVSSVIPCSREESFTSARLKGDFTHLGYVDSPPLRVIIDCMKADKSHSSTNVGKATMLGTRMETPRAELRPLTMMASYLQDGILSTYRSPDPKYLPSIMGGSGVPALFNNHWNIFLYTRSYRGGGYDRLYGTATQELKGAVESIDINRPHEPALCLRLRDRQEYLHGTYAEKVLMPPKDMMDFRGVMPPPLYKAMGVSNGVQAVELRLQRTKTLVTRSLAEREFDKTARIHDAIFGLGTSPITAKRLERTNKFLLRQEFEGALRSNSAFKRLLDRKAKPDDVAKLIGEGFNPVTTGKLHFDIFDAKWIYEGCRGAYASALDITRSEDMFLRTDVSTEETFKIGGIPLKLRLFGKTKYEVTKTRVGLYQINESMLEWSERLATRLTAYKEEYGIIPKPLLIDLFRDNSEWVNDDTGLIAQCIQDTVHTSIHCTVILISQDKRLANQMAASANVSVVLVDTESLIEVFPNRDWNSLSQITVAELKGKFKNDFHFELPPQKVYIDTGSLAHVASRYSRGEQGPWDRNLYKRNLIQAYQDTNGLRHEILELEILKPRKTLVARRFKPRANRQKTFPYFKGSSSSSESSSNWRSGWDGSK